ncbi:PIN domain-containing protein [Synechococcus sp. PCC 7336]|uniref:type II toxin-antitoxin system VapC family toxin n=1 Tax=Synechococcus sp. PCC 7336 TaxID=195250 RepID=UPI00034901F8|nr:PIN domain-containing protein [Synechococcus sp. PCC 7336]
MKYLVDTNIWLRSIEEEHPDCMVALNAAEILIRQGNELYLIPQIIAEFWNACTRPMERNGFGLSHQETKLEVERLEGLLLLREDVPGIYPIWKDLIDRYQVRGVKVHDTRLVAAMLMHELTHLLTFNIKDFKRFKEIVVVHPSSISG